MTLPAGRWSLLLLAALGGCPVAPDDDPQVRDERVPVPEAPAEGEGVQLLTGEFVVPPGEEVMWCSVADWSPTEDVFVNGLETWQQLDAGGHHVVALGASVPFEPGYEFDCTNIESMTALEPLVLPNSGDTADLPEGYAIRVPAGANVVIQSHYINYTAEPILVRDVAHLMFYQGVDPIEASYIILNHGGLDLPTGLSTAEVTCTLPTNTSAYKVISLLGHMHEYGQSIDVMRQPGAVGEWEPVYEVPDWDPEFRDLPPTTQWDATAPLALEPGDRLRVRCAWDNVTGANLRFPSEMCTSVALYYPASASGLLVCDEDGGPAE